ncbi:MAG: sigma-54 dependent transcriptional regulator [Thermodesulfovibrionales bacterium]|nr:sigma-54 dependent transcriptional regulator [Thermodesulfovibrionales bacterium]
MGRSILIVEDDDLMRSFITTVLTDEGYTVDEAQNGKTGLSKLHGLAFDLVIADLRMPDISGLDLMSQGKKARPETKWIIITAYGSIRNAVDAIKAGASDYLTKPFQSPDELRIVVRRVLREIDNELAISLLSEEIGKNFPPIDMIFLGEKMQEIYRMVSDVAPTPANVLITGQSGTGKELIARVIHQLSARKEKPFIAVNCAALVHTLIESELFGHEKGAFTGAVASRKGRFESADNGTIFLDEVGELPQSVQVKLLRVLQEKTFERVGGNRTLSVDIRIITATNKDLKEEISSGRFREDLFYRLNVFPIALPALGERREVILPLAEYFFKKYSASLGKKIAGFTGTARSQLLMYGWPGNIRELQNVIERAVILSNDVIDTLHLNLEAPDENLLSREGLLKMNEKEMITKVLHENGGNRKRTAQLLGISLRTLQYRIKEYGIG